MLPFMFVLMQFAVLAYAIVGGAFLTFSDFVMRSMSWTRGVGGVEAMQVINREVFRWAFMSLFLGMTSLSVIIFGYALFSIEGPAGTLMLWAAGVYLVGCFLVTAAFNVPMNKRWRAWIFPPMARSPIGGPPMCRAGRSSIWCAPLPAWSSPS
ncbi:anthrone oxygenase family protein [Breoghania sp.]|uniref:anthrone oxygenase family protein n=1 Tax=Breoghania sp. TaxID=2065378 RepID=UPI0026395C17|nr:anthrone oxygenase family protein [Breoghania sp.]MDJ0931609.1 DUF1772 domain-containing protein [Breoghania sp.]